MNQVYDLKVAGWNARTIAKKLGKNEVQISSDLKILSESVKSESKKARLLERGRPELTKKRLDMAYRQKEVYNRRLKAEETIEEIAEALKVDFTLISHDLHDLAGSVSEETAGKLLEKRERKEKRLTEKDLRFAYLLNQIYDLRIKERLTLADIGKRVHRDQTTISNAIKLLEKSTGKETAAKLRKWGRQKLTERSQNKAYRMNHVYNLRKQGKSEVEIAKMLNTDPGTIAVDLADLKKSVKPERRKRLEKRVKPWTVRRRNEKAKVLRWIEDHPFKAPALDPAKADNRMSKTRASRIESAVWNKWVKRYPGEMMKRIERLDRAIQKTRNPNELNSLAIERRTIIDLLRYYY